MSHYLVILALAIIATKVHAAPVAKNIDPELSGGFFEGDIILPTTRIGLRNSTYRWPNNTVYYKFHKGDFDDEHINHILRGMRNIEAVSCIRFMEATPEHKNFVEITGARGGCFSSVGYSGAVQSYNLEIYPLDSGCFRMGTIMHEFLHTLGFYHMQSAPDRDEYVKIVEENIQEDLLFNFDKYDDTFVDSYDQEYDYGSVMHYPADAFSKNGKLTIIPLREAEAAGVMGQRREMSKSDINRLNTMYRCPLDA